MPYAALQARSGTREIRYGLGVEAYEISRSTCLEVEMATSSENDRRVAAFLALIRYAEFAKHEPADV